MEIVRIILPLVLGALIGYITNYVAVKMLFRPYNPIMIGSKKLPFTPGVIPKNKGRIARACGNAIEDNLLSKEDIKDVILSKKTEKDIIAGICEGLRIKDFVGANKDKISEDICKRILSEIKKADVRKIIIEKGGEAIEEKVKGTMLAMFLNRGAIESFADPITKKIYDYFDGEGKILMEDSIRSQLQQMEALTLKETGEEMDIDVEALLSDVYQKVMLNGVERMLSNIEIASIVETKIEEMDAKEFEKLVLSVMKRELRAIVNFGALIGFVIGLVNLLVLI